MSDRQAYDLYKEMTNESRRPAGQGDGWTLHEHLVEHARLPTAVEIDDQPQLLVVTHSTPGRLKFFIALAVLLVAALAAWMLKLIPPFAQFGPTHWAIGISIIALIVATVYASLAHTKMGINHNGLIARPWPYVPGIGVVVPLKQIRRFKVNKIDRRGSTRYELHVLTNQNAQHRMIPHIVRKRDAYLMAMLLIDRVKRIRNDAA